MRLLAGLQAGTAGGLLMLAYFSLQSAILRQPWWSMANLLGTAIYGQSALWRGLGRATLAGAALQLLIAAAVGILFGVFFSRLRGWTAPLLLGIATGVACFFFCHDGMFGRISPLIPVYAPRSSTIVGHLLLGLALSRVAAIYRSLEPVFARAPATEG